MRKTPWGMLVAVSGLPASFGFSLLLGWLKLLYYYAAFGVSPGLLRLDALDYLRESWFVLQNLAFFALMWWVALAVRRSWIVVLATIYSLLPIAAHYAFALDNALASALIDGRHTLLKGVPFATLIGIWLFRPACRDALRGRGRRFGVAAVLLCALVAVSWAISTAKHFGSFDAQRAMREPDRYLSRVQIEDVAPAGSRWYLVASGPREVLLWRRPETREQGLTVDVLLLPRERAVPMRLGRRLQVQPGDLYF